MSSEVIFQNVAYDIIMIIFNMSASYFHKISFHYFWLLLNDETDLRVRLFVCFVCHIKISQIMVSLVALLIPTGEEECSMSVGGLSWFHNVLTYGEEVIG
jgi:hypothetical protein